MIWRATWVVLLVVLFSATLEAQDEVVPSAGEEDSIEEAAPPSEEAAGEAPSGPDTSDGDTLVVEEEVPNAVVSETLTQDVPEVEAPVAAAPSVEVESAPVQEASPSARASAESEPEAEEEVEQDAHTLDRSNERWRPWFAVLAHISLLSDRLAVSTLNIRFGYGINVGARRGPWGVYGHIEQNLYAETEFDFVARAGTLNIAVGGERFFFRERLRMAAAVGVSVLLTDLALHSVGHTGLFVQIKPAGIRFARQSQVVIQLDLASITVAAPVLGSPSVVDLQYRTTLGIEWQGQH